MIKKWRTTKDSIAFKGNIFRYRQLDRESTTNDLKGQFDVLDFLDWVNVVAVTSSNELILVKQYRHGIDNVTLEVPAGAIHPGEDHLLAAKRELREETGYISNHWKFLGVVQPNPAIQSNLCSLYLAENCIYEGEPQLDPLEEIELVLRSKSQIKQMILNQEIQHSLTLNALYLADLVKES
ncbi:MAG: NTP pyrophosphohydrolase [Bdellovibrionales bacterium CG12_big_fil_rev_8_21_14_0_65_38_15]|nr:MAG: NTP pyrophosphohydrolase [Bdellovibrionales bacterium CG22_combo_CG10-13_8_21_14_all_38_13]PIQ57188.1 MAG: NTP pyrophosphohydrolase [Bdellovibrionales bacterium CG12_big_fil_rev_8_21_14_0_65_38_15]PIR31382.1 MAG: NTP pyrophosphohydrolase [Bdellovibrionales bacterium CG11_big_fil_rev_8_21_14_0_20_38_13]